VTDELTNDEVETLEADRAEYGKEGPPIFPPSITDQEPSENRTQDPNWEPNRHYQNQILENEELERSKAAVAGPRYQLRSRNRPTQTETGEGISVEIKGTEAERAEGEELEVGEAEQLDPLPGLSASNEGYPQQNEDPPPLAENVENLPRYNLRRLPGRNI
jgi:hypothetical protein